MRTPPAIAPGALSGRPQPVLAAPGGLVLRPWEDADAPVYFGAYADPAVQRWHREPVSEQQVLDWFALFRQNWQEETGASWAVTRDSGEVIGRMALGSFNLGDGNAGCAYWVLPTARGAGVAPRALTAMADWAFSAGFHRLHLNHSTRNNPSCRVAEKAGFLVEGILRSSAIHADGRHDMHTHARILESR